MPDRGGEGVLELQSAIVDFGRKLRVGMVAINRRHFQGVMVCVLFYCQWIKTALFHHVIDTCVPKTVKLHLVRQMQLVSK